MPTDRKIGQVEEIKKLIEEATVAISTDYTGMSVDDMNDLRRALREHGVIYRIVKNRLTELAADAAGKPEIKEIVQGPTGVAFGFGDPVEPARAIADFLKANTRSTLKVRAGIMGDRPLSESDVEHLASLPSRDQLIAQLMGQLQGPMSGLAYVLNAPVNGLATVLQRKVEAEAEGAAAE